MTVSIEKSNGVWTVIHARPEARNAVDNESAVGLYDAFVAFNNDSDAKIAVFWGEGGAFCAGWDLKQAAALVEDTSLQALDFTESGGSERAPMGPSRLALDKPVIAAIAGPAVAGGMELALWCDFRVMEEDAYMGVYCRRWGVPLIDGGTVRLPRLVGEGRAMELILTGRKIEADECARIGLCEYVVPRGSSRERAEALAHDIARFPQSCLLADRRSARRQHGLSERAAMVQEWRGSRDEVKNTGIAGAARFASGRGRGGDFSEI
ncbi:MAG: crotonase/enoyl-CoA hydratase family protein [Pseudomonadota bacterium]